jgi:hypothetical protein
MSPRRTIPLVSWCRRGLYPVFRVLLSPVIAVAMALSSAASSQCAQAESGTRIVGRDDRCRDPVPVHRHPVLSDEVLEATHGWIDTGISHISALRYIAR